MARNTAAKRETGAQYGSMRWVMIAILLVVMLFTALPAMCLFLPAILVLITEREPNRPLTRAVSLFGLAGAWESLGLLWKVGGLGLSAWTHNSWLVTLDLHRLGIAWAAQGAGWLVAEGIAIVLSLLADARTRKYVESAERRRAVLSQEWISTDTK